MRALIINELQTSFMQACDLFEPFKVLYHDIILDYRIKTDKREEIKITDEDIIVKIAKKEFGDKLIVLLGSTEIKYKNEKIKVLSNGKNWTLLDKFIENVYKNR